jgi:putative N-acetyltransferase (TIGR04045 family)
MLFQAYAPFVPPQFGIKLATEPWERAAHFRLRRAVFCREQGIFENDDRDATDEVATPIVAVDYVMGMSHRVVGTVRIHETTPGVWQGSRLAIDAAHRTVYGLGSGLVYRAVGTARARGCAEFLATVQRANVPFFRRLAWEELEAIDLYGRPHALMRADLAAYPACGEDPVTLVHSRRAS